MYKKGDLVRIKEKLDMSAWDQSFLDWYNNLPLKQLEIARDQSQQDYVYLKTPGYYNSDVCINLDNLEPISDTKSTPKSKPNFFAITKDIVGG